MYNGGYAMGEGVWNPNANASFSGGEIDKLVYELYGLTAEEIGIVEG